MRKITDGSGRLIFTGEFSPSGTRRTGDLDVLMRHRARTRGITPHDHATILAALKAISRKLDARVPTCSN
jgi:hypothetical protein